MKDVVLTACSLALIVGVSILVYRATRGTNRSARLLLAIFAGAMTFALVDWATVQFLR